MEQQQALRFQRAFVLTNAFSDYYGGLSVSEEEVTARELL